MANTYSEPINSPNWKRCASEDLPNSFSDPRIGDFRTCCSNGFVSDLSIGSAFMHSPDRWPQCFPNGPDSDAVCENFFQRRAPSVCKPGEPK